MFCALLVNRPDSEAIINFYEVTSSVLQGTYNVKYNLLIT